MTAHFTIPHPEGQDIELTVSVRGRGPLDEAEARVIIETAVVNALADEAEGTGYVWSAAGAWVRPESSPSAQPPPDPIHEARAAVTAVQREVEANTAGTLARVLHAETLTPLDGETAGHHRARTSLAATNALLDGAVRLATLATQGDRARRVLVARLAVKHGQATAEDLAVLEEE